MQKLVLVVGVTALCSAGALATTHTPIVITACVHAGTDPNTYVLLDVDEVTDGRPVPAGAVYWLSSADDLTAHVGHKVEVRGTYSLDRDAVPAATVTTKAGPATLDHISAPRSRVSRTAINDRMRAVGTTGVAPAAVKRPYRRLAVSAVRLMNVSCDVP